MAKKKREVCPYCGKSFAYLSRHKCKIKEKVEGVEETEREDVERRIERIQERKKDYTRNLKKDEKSVLEIIRREKEIYFEDLLNLTKKTRSELDGILEILSLQSKIKMRRELFEASWTKNISYIEKIDIDVKEIDYDLNKKDFILELFSSQPCLVCPFSGRCNETNLDKYNPQICPWLTEWIQTSLEDKKYVINFDEVQMDIVE